MTELGCLGARFVDGRLEIGDPGDSMAAQAAQLAEFRELAREAGLEVVAAEQQPAYLVVECGTA